MKFNAVLSASVAFAIATAVIVGVTWYAHSRTDDSEHYTALSPNPDLLKWINQTEVKSGGTTCGFLEAPLGWNYPAQPYPKVNVYVCMTFAKKQPARKGTIFKHCGGPGSLSACPSFFLPSMDETMTDDFNVVSIDQRGLGRSWPTFMIPECALDCEKHNPNDQCQNVTDPNNPNGPTVTISGSFDNRADYEDEDEMRLLLKRSAKRIQKCWAAPSFSMTGTDGKSKFHWLEYSGTQQLVEDIDRVRQVG
jgi:hypothetical protein